MVGLGTGKYKTCGSEWHNAYVDISSMTHTVSLRKTTACVAATDSMKKSKEVAL
jgi:hypothetical protein